MRPVLLSWLLALSLIGGGSRWQVAPPAGEGMDAAALQRATEVLRNRRTKNFLVVRNGKIVHEWYAADSGPAKPHYTASMAKALVGGLSLMLAMQDGRLRIDDRAAQYIGAWKNDAVRSRITIRQLATHSSGIEDAEQDKLPHADLPGWKGAFWRRQPDPFTIAIHQAPVIFEPGTRYAYSNPGMAALAYAVTSSFKGAPQSDIRTLLKERILDPIGVGDAEWSIGYGQAYEVDGLKLYANWGGGSFSARAVARVGQLMLQQGRWNDRQLVDGSSVARAVAYAGTPVPDRREDPAPASGLGWWTNHDGVWRSLPRDAFAGAGAGHQVLLVVPSLQLVVVRNGGALNEPGEPGGFWTAIERFVFNPVVAAAADGPASEPRMQSPYPPSAFITTLSWAPVAEIVRQAHGSDNWPITWAADDSLYTAYGDGWGFEPRTEKKLSVGFARITGGPTDFTAVNVRSAEGERVGDGAAGEKASGMLSIANTLYMWLRNTGNSRLAWSIDRGVTWARGNWKFDVSFGHPAFLNFGKEYAGARDDYVYVYSPDRNSAYEPADHLVLARVARTQLRARDAYEFLALDAAGHPIWTKDIGRRGAAFTHRGRSYRSQVSYHPVLKRYLLCQTHPEGDARFGGGFGIYDAPEPWGPWTTVYFTNRWDVSPGESCSFPTKWMGSDPGQTTAIAHLVFSGDDSFSVRRVTFEVGK